MTNLSPNALLDFSGKVVVVTGSGSGMGTGIARRFAQAGARVSVNYRQSAGGALEIVEAIRAEGGEAVAIQADVTQPAEVGRLIQDTVKAFGRIDVLVNNAGVYPQSALIDMTLEEWDLVINANLRGTFLCTQAAARQMIEQGEGGAVVNISSIEGENPAPMHSHYNAAKGGVGMFTQSAASELGQYAIRVNAVSPGLIWREGLDEAWPDGVRRYKQAAPLGRLGRPEDVADACLFLASPAARWITGANLRVDGGVMTKQIF